MTGLKPDSRNITWSWNRTSKSGRCEFFRGLLILFSPALRLPTYFLLCDSGAFRMAGDSAEPYPSSAPSYSADLGVCYGTGATNWNPGIRKTGRYAVSSWRVPALHRRTSCESERSRMPATHRARRPPATRSHQTSWLGQQTSRACATRIVGSARILLGARPQVVGRGGA